MIEYVMIFLLSAIPWVEIAIAIPLGMVRQLQPILVVIIGFIGNLTTVVLLIYLNEKVKGYFSNREKRKKKRHNRQQRAREIWNKYGLPGLAIVGPILIGIHIAAFIGLTLGASKKRTFIWMGSSLFLWSILFGIASYYGIETFKMFI